MLFLIPLIFLFSVNSLCQFKENYRFGVFEKTDGIFFIKLQIGEFLCILFVKWKKLVENITFTGKNLNRHPFCSLVVPVPVGIYIIQNT